MGSWRRSKTTKRQTADKKQSEGNEDETKATHTRFDDDEEPAAKKVKAEDDS